jgi:hypothetical protein
MASATPGPQGQPADVGPEWHRVGAGPSVAARFASLEEARGAIVALEHAGLDGNDLELLGRAVEAARVPRDPKRADRRLVFYLLPRLAAGLALGSGAGLGLGLLIAGVLMGAGVLSWSWGAFGVCVLIALFPGATLGVFLAFERSVGVADDWSLTFEDPGPGAVWVGVYTRDDEFRAKARHVLEQRRPLELR